MVVKEKTLCYIVIVLLLIGDQKKNNNGAKSTNKVSRASSGIYDFSCFVLLATIQTNQRDHSLFFADLQHVYIIYSKIYVCMYMIYMYIIYIACIFINVYKYKQCYFVFICTGMFNDLWILVKRFPSHYIQIA